MAYQIARMVRNAFSHHMLRPVRSIDAGCESRQFAVGDVIALDTSDLNGKMFDWRHYGWHLAIWRLSQCVRFNVLGGTPPGAIPLDGLPDLESNR